MSQSKENPSLVYVPTIYNKLIKNIHHLNCVLDKVRTGHSRWNLLSPDYERTCRTDVILRVGQRNLLITICAYDTTDQRQGIRFVTTGYGNGRYDPSVTVDNNFHSWSDVQTMYMYVYVKHQQQQHTCSLTAYSSKPNLDLQLWDYFIYSTITEPKQHVSFAKCVPENTCNTKFYLLDAVVWQKQVPASNKIEKTTDTILS